jgi:hypothetical protein
MEFTGPKPTGTSRQSKPVAERRQSVRLKVHSPAYANLDESSQGGGRELNGILDISERGMSMQTSSPLKLDSNLNFCLDLSETRTRIRTNGQVIWSDDSGRAGVRFPKLAPQSLKQLRQWLFVNVLTAFDHARSWTAGADIGTSYGASNDSHFSQHMRHNELTSGATESSGRDGSLTAVKDMQNKVESATQDREVALQLIAEQAMAFTRAAGAAIALSEGDAMLCVASAGPDAPSLGTTIQVGSGFSGECIRTGRSLRCDDSETDDRVDREGCRTLGIRSMVAVPIRRGHRVTGLLEVFAAQPFAFNGQDISVLQQLTGTILSTVGAEPEAAPVKPDVPKGPSVRVQPARTQSPQVQPQPVRSPQAQSTQIRPPQTGERPVSGVMSGTMAAVAPVPRPVFHKILLVAAALTFIFAVVWLVAPWALSRMHTTQPSPQVQQSQAVAKPRSVPSEVSDLGGLRNLAEQGDPAAQFALGARYATGEGVKQDYTEAVSWFTQAADRGHILAQATLGAYYWAGRGVSPDLTKAYFWSALAQAGGDQASKYRVAVLTSRMSRNEILAAQQQANEWLHNHPAANIRSSQ